MRATVTILARSLIALIAGLALTAFAPAPLPRPSRDRATADSVRAQDIQGVWRAISIEEKQPDGRMVRQSWPTNRMLIRGDRWTFCTDQKESFSVWMTLDGPRIDLRGEEARTSPITMCGVLRRRGNLLHLLYTFDGPDNRPTDFERIPATRRVMTLERER